MKLRHSCPWGLLLAMLLGLLVRVVAIDRHSFWYDEVVSAGMTSASYSQLFTGGVKDNGNPPLYWILLKAWTIIWGQQETVCRSLSVIFSLATIPIIWLLGRRLCDAPTGIAAALFFAISPLEVEFANEARCYALLHFLVVLNCFALVRWVQVGTLMDRLLYATTLCLAFYCHYYAFLIPAIHGGALIFSPRERRLIPGWIVAVLLAGLLWLPWARAFLAQITIAGNLARSMESWHHQFMITPIAFTVGRTLVWRESGLYLVGACSAAVLVVFFLTAGWGLYQVRSRPFSFWLLSLWMLAPVAVPFAMALLSHPLYSHRYGAIALPAVLICLAKGFVTYPPRLRWLCAILIVGLSAASLVKYASFPAKDDWRNATSYISEAAGNSAIAIIDNGIEVATFRYYSKERDIPASIIGISEAANRNAELFYGTLYKGGVKQGQTPSDQSALVGKAEKVYLALCVPTRPFSAYERYFKEHGYRLTDHRSFYRIDVYQYAKEHKE